MHYQKGEILGFPIQIVNLREKFQIDAFCPASRGIRDGNGCLKPDGFLLY
jgi:hypothetical protein